MAIRYKTGATPTTPEQKSAFAAQARKTILDDVVPILHALAIRHEIVVANTLAMKEQGGMLELRFPGLDTGDFLCQITFELPIVRTGNRWNRNDGGGTAHSGVIHFKTMQGPSNRYFHGNWKNWGKSRMAEIETYLDDFMATAKLFHKKRTDAVTLVPRLKAALERRSVPGGCTAKVTVEATAKGYIRTIERMLTHENYYTQETYLYNEEDNTLILNSSNSSGLLSDPFSI